MPVRSQGLSDGLKLEVKVNRGSSRRGVLSGLSVGSGRLCCGSAFVFDGEKLTALTALRALPWVSGRRGLEDTRQMGGGVKANWRVWCGTSSACPFRCGRDAHP